jgi:hypothetical protein
MTACSISTLGRSPGCLSDESSRRYRAAPSGTLPPTECEPRLGFRGHPEITNGSGAQTFRVKRLVVLPIRTQAPSSVREASTGGDPSARLPPVPAPSRHVRCVEQGECGLATTLSSLMNGGVKSQQKSMSTTNRTRVRPDQRSSVDLQRGHTPGTWGGGARTHDRGIMSGGQVARAGRWARCVSVSAGPMLGLTGRTEVGRGGEWYRDGTTPRASGLPRGDVPRAGLNDGAPPP